MQSASRTCAVGSPMKPPRTERKSCTGHKVNVCVWALRTHLPLSKTTCEHSSCHKTAAMRHSLCSLSLSELRGQFLLLLLTLSRNQSHPSAPLGVGGGANGAPHQFAGGDVLLVLPPEQHDVSCHSEPPESAASVANLAVRRSSTRVLRHTCRERMLAKAQQELLVWP